MERDRVSFEHFMKNQIATFIHQELLKGHSPLAIKETLLKGGHHADMVSGVLDILKEHNYDLNAALQAPVKGRLLKQELFYDVLNSVIKYVEHMLEAGHDIHEIENQLYKHGHTKDIVTKAIDAVLFGKEEKIERPKDLLLFAEKFVLPLMLVIYLVFALLISTSANTSIDKVIIGFIGFLFTIIVSGLSAPKLNQKYKLGLLVAPFAFGFLMSLFKTSPIFAGMDIARLSVLNILFGLIATGVFIVSSVDKTTRQGKTIQEEKPKELLESAEEE